MKFSSSEQSLYKAIKKIPVIDTHEHLPPEEIHLDMNVDLITLFNQYVCRDLHASGMAPEYRDNLYDFKIPVKKRWRMLAPYLENIKYGSYARAAFISIKEFYGYDEVNKDNCEDLSEQIHASRTSGIYHRVLREKCNIQQALSNSWDRTNFDLDLIVPVPNIGKYIGIERRKPLTKENIEENALCLGEKVESLDDYLVVVRKGVEKWKKEGAVGLKTISSSYTLVNKKQAEALFKILLKGDTLEEIEIKRLFSFFLDKICDIASDLSLVIAVHTGVWGDFRELDPQHMMPIMKKHSSTKFDLYHAGIPFIREMAVMTKNFPNMWFNLCWAHLISPKMMQLLMDELIDMVPVNKVLAFGGDYGLAAENIFGSLTMSRESITRVLAGRIEDEILTENEAIEIAKKWYYDNPKQLYQL